MQQKYGIDPAKFGASGGGSQQDAAPVSTPAATPVVAAAPPAAAASRLPSASGIPTGGARKSKIDLASIKERVARARNARS